MKKIEYFIGEFNRINEGLENRNLDADDVINIVPVNSVNFITRIDQEVIVYYKK